MNKNLVEVVARALCEEEGLDYDEPSLSDDGLPLGLFWRPAALAALRAIEAAGYSIEPGWQPIETAPRDGTEILGWIVHPGDLYFQEPFARTTIMSWRAAFECFGDIQPAGWDQMWIGNPTHWRPLPTFDAAPTIGGRDE